MRNVSYRKRNVVLRIARRIRPEAIPINIVIAAFVLCALSLWVAPTAQAQARESSQQVERMRTQAYKANGPCQYGPTIDYNCLKNIDPHANNSEVPQTNVKNPISVGSLLYFYTPFDITADNTLVRNLWAVMLFIVDLSGGVILMLNGVKVMLVGSVFRYANAIEALPGVLLGLVSAHLSLLIVIFFLGLNNMLSLGLYNLTEVNPAFSRTQANFTAPECQLQNTGLGAPGCTALSAVAQTVATLRGPTPPGAMNNVTDQALNKIANSATAQVPVDPVLNSITPTNLEFTNIWQNLTSLTDILGLLLKVLGLILLAQLMIRLFLINLYTILGPLGIAAWALPGKAGQPLTKLWLTGFISVVMVQFVQVAALVVTQLLLGAIANYLHAQVSDQVLSAATLVGVLRVAVLWFVIRIPSLLGTAPMRTMVETGQAMQQAVAATFAIQVATAQAAASAASSALEGGIGLTVLRR